MNLSIDQLAKSILKKDTLADCSVHELEQLVDKYPYFSAARLLLTKKLEADNAEQYLKQLQKTVEANNNIKLYANIQPEEMLHVMQQSHIAIASSSIGKISCHSAVSFAIVSAVRARL